MTLADQRFWVMYASAASIDNGSKIRANEPLTTKELAASARRRSYLISAAILSL